MNTSLLAKLVRWTARAASLVIFAFVLLSATGPAATPSFREAVGLVFFPGLLLAGFALAWWREARGAAVATVGLLGFYAWSWASGAHFARGPWFIVCWSPTLFFLTSWLLHRQRSLSGTSSA